MIFWYLLILIIALVNVRICKNGFFQDYLGKEQSNAIKGVFILLVFLGHALLDIKLCGFSFEHKIDWLAQGLYREMGQLVVVMFLFYSGYGVMKSLLSKGKAYLASYPRKRLLATLLNFDVAVCCFILLAWIMGHRMDCSRIVLSFIGWDTFGNSNWYIFVILCCYLAFYVVFRIVGNRYRLGAAALWAVSFAGMITLYFFKPSRWYNTVLVFPAGVVYALFFNELEKWIQKRYGLVTALLLVAFVFLHFMMRMHPLHGLTCNMKSIVFVLLIVALTMKVRINNRWIQWCGLSLFPIYIYQRLPMISIRGLLGSEWVCGHPHFFIGGCFVVTVGIAFLYNKYFRIKLA